MAEHAFAAGDTERAAQGWLLAGEAAMNRFAVDDAAALYKRALAVTDDPALRARLLVARSATREARVSFAEGLTDIDEGLRLARATGDRRLQMMALRARGGDVPIGLNVPTADLSAHLEEALSIASELGDRRAEADVSARLSVLDVSRLRFRSAIERAEATLRRVASHEASTRTLALDGLKTALAYLGAADRLQEVLDELEPELRRRESSWLLQWVVFESAFVYAAHGRWDECRERVAEAVALNARTGYSAYAGFFEAHQGWFERLAGDLDAALQHGRRAVERTSAAEHPWWYAAACGQLAATLLEAGDPSAAEATARRGLAATGPGTAEAWRLRCAAPLAALSDDDADWTRAVGLLRGIEVPQGHAWVAGADCYLLVGRAALRRGAVADIAVPLSDLHQATATLWTPIRLELDALRSQMSSATS
jgi:tetratricopeptide (TPR) repeat protein